MTTYAEFSHKSESNKVGLVKLDAAKRLLGWTLDTGSVYEIQFAESPVITRITQDGTNLTQVGAYGSIVAGSYYFDRSTDTLYLRTSDSTSPNGKFIGVVFRLFFATEPVIAPHDLSTGFDVEWLPLLKPLSTFGVRLNNADQTGQAIEGSGSISFFNDQDYWRSVYDKYFFENKLCEIFSWSNSLSITEAELIYRGKVQGKSYSQDSVSFSLKDIINQLRASPPLSKMSAVSGARLPDGLLEAFQRRIYGYKLGYRPTNIDQVLDAYPLTGTLAITSGSTSVTGTSTTFLNDLSPGDELVINGVEDPVTVESITSNTALVLSDEFDSGTISGASFSVKPDMAKRYTNRVHFVSGDALAEPATTVTSALNNLIFTVADATGFRAGDPVVVNSEERTILRVSNNIIRVTVSFSSIPSGAVTRPSFSNVRINNTLLLRFTDYTVPASNDRIELSELAEFNRAKVKTLSPGTISMTSGSRTVSGTSTDFLTLKPGDWIRVKGASTNTFFEILQISSATSLTLRIASDTTASGSADLKTPVYYQEGTDVLTCDVIGKTDNGVKTGEFLYTPAQIARDVLRSVGVVDTDVNDTSFTEAQDLVSYRLGIAIPDDFNSKTVPKARDIINRINESSFTALVQNEDYKLEFKALAPGREVTEQTVDETQALSFSVDSKSDRIIKTAFINYNHKEYDPLTFAESFQTAFSSSEIAEFLAETENTVTKDTLLVDEADAQTVAERLRFIREVSSSVVKFRTKLQTARLQVTDIIKFSHPKLYERFGSTQKEKIGAIQSLKKSSSEVELEIEDLGNAFNRSYTLTEDTAPEFSLATDDQKAVNGFITDDSGLIDNDPNTTGLYLIY